MQETTTSVPWERPKQTVETFVQAKQILEDEISQRQVQHGVSRSTAIVHTMDFAHRLLQRIFLDQHRSAFALYITQLMCDPEVRAAAGRTPQMNAAAGIECVMAAIRENFSRGKLDDRRCASEAVGWGRANVAPRIRDLDDLQEFLLRMNELEQQYFPLTLNAQKKAIKRFWEWQEEFDSLPPRDPDIDRLAIILTCEQVRLYPDGIIPDRSEKEEDAKQ